MRSATLRCAARCLLLACCASRLRAAAACSKQEYEYEEELYLALDGSATLNVNASVAALVALRGADLDRRSARARRSRRACARCSPGPGVDVSRVSLSRRDGRRFVHVAHRRRRCAAAVAAGAVRVVDLSLRSRRATCFEYRQVVGEPAGKRRRRRRLDRRRARRVPHAPPERDPVPQRAVEAGASGATSWSGSSRWPSGWQGDAARASRCTWSRSRSSTRRCCCSAATIVAAALTFARGDLVGGQTRRDGECRRQT